MKPYVGAGLVYRTIQSIARAAQGPARAASVWTSPVGLNFTANSKLMPFVEVKLGLGGSTGYYSGSEFIIKGGLHF